MPPDRAGRAQATSGSLSTPALAVLASAPCPGSRPIHPSLASSELVSSTAAKDHSGNMPGGRGTPANWARQVCFRSGPPWSFATGPRQPPRLRS